MMENRSFDHYFGWHPRADGRNAGLTYPNLDGTQTFPTHHLTPDFQGCDFRDPDHGWDGGRHQFNGGKMDGFYTRQRGRHRQRRVRARLLPEGGPRLPPARGRRLHALRPLVLLDHGLDLSEPPLPDWRPRTGARSRTSCPPETEQTTGFQWETILDRALARGVDGRLLRLRPAGPGALRRRVGSPGCARRRSSTPTPPHGNLPQICFIDPPFRDGGGGDGISADDHPHGDVRLGQAFMSDVAHAFIESPQYRARRDVHQLRRVGRLLRPRRAAPRPRRPREPRRTSRGLVADRLPDPGGRDLALRPSKAGAGSAT